jgi:Phosphotriesterase family
MDPLSIPPRPVDRTRDQDWGPRTRDPGLGILDGQFRPFGTLFTKFIPALTNAGVTKDDVRTLLIENPRRALTREG